MKKLLKVGALVSALALVGCAPIEFEQAYETAPAVSPARAAEMSAERALSAEGQEWADSLMGPYTEARQNFADDSMPGAPVRRVMSWGAKSPGALDVRVSGRDWKSGEDLDYLASRIMQFLNNDSVASVTVATLEGENSGMATAPALEG